MLLHKRKTTSWSKAVSIGVVYDRPSGKIVRVINPTFEEELGIHSMTSDEFMLKVDKTRMGISPRADAMTLDDVARLLEAMS